MGVKARGLTKPRAEAVHVCVAEEPLGPLQAGSRDVPGCSRAALQRPDTTTMGSLEGMINIGSSQWLSGRFSDFPTAVQCVSGEAGLAAGCPWPPALSAAGSSCITQSECGAAELLQPGDPHRSDPKPDLPPPARTWMETGRLEPWSWDLPESFVDT